MTKDKTIYTFWEPAAKMPGYISPQLLPRILCKKMAREKILQQDIRILINH